MARKCIFCGAKADSREHVFPDWINGLLLDKQFEGQHFQIVMGETQDRRRYLTTEAAGLRAKIVCRTCNHGWLSDLERLASRVLAPMMLGTESTVSIQDQLLVAWWAVKTAMVGEATMYEANSFTQEDRELVREHQRPPMRARVSLAAYSLEEPVATRYTRGLGKVHRDGAPYIDVYVHTIQVLYLVLAVRGTDTFPATDNRSLETIAEPRYLEIPVFPPVEVCRWPPNFVLNEAAFMEYTGANNLARDR